MLYKIWQVPCILWPSPNTARRFCCVSIPPQSLCWWWSPESHIPIWFITTFPFCVLVSALHRCENISTSPSSFLLSSSLFTVAQVLAWSVCLRAALQVSETFIFWVSTTLCCDLLWKLREEKGGSTCGWENAPPMLCLIEQTSSLCTNSLASSWKVFPAGLEWCSTQLNKRNQFTLETGIIWCLIVFSHKPYSFHHVYTIFRGTWGWFHNWQQSPLTKFISFQCKSTLDSPPTTEW